MNYEGWAVRLNLLWVLSLAPAAGPALAGLPAAAPAAPTAAINVTTTADEFGAGPDCALREAIEAARLKAPFGGCPAGSPGEMDLISLSPVTYTLSLAPGGDNNNNATGDLDIGSALTLTVVGGGGAVIQQTANDRVLHVVTTTVVAVQGVTLTGGVTTGGGGGLLAQLGAPQITLLEVSVVSNTASLGAGISLDGATLTATRSAVLSNTATLAVGGGGFFINNAELRLTNVTVAGNRVPNGPGGGLYQNAGLVHLNNVSVVSNTASAGGGLYLGGGVLNFRNTLVADNAAAGLGPDCGSAGAQLTSHDYNLIESTADCPLTGTTTHNLTGDPLLGPLQDNGGFSLTRLPGAGSPALDAGNPAGCADQAGAEVRDDQRGRPRPRDGDLNGVRACDLGAVEVEAVGPVFIPFVGR